ncbi:E3 ubiquitin-protein ligase RNF144A isoform X3 [Felis catus]|uniref:E3 ubiquitin-protein ligase RNF144A isoform X3 n=1 Tax=Felis catus TaxID=9685 RepID=UPI001D19AEFF|nr:E3 ubiquitin-protein ligase RNF144A isoform X3 [Felis catus]
MSFHLLGYLKSYNDGFGSFHGRIFKSHSTSFSLLIGVFRPSYIITGAEHPAECGPLQVPTCGGTPGPETFSHVSVRVAGHEGRGRLSARERSRTPGFGQKTFLSSPRTSQRPLLQSPPESETGPLQQSSQPPTPSCPGGTHQSAAAAHSCDASGTDCSAMTTARYRPTWDLALDPLVSCKLCLGEYPVEQMTTIAQCQCIFCTLGKRQDGGESLGGLENPLCAHRLPLGGSEVFLCLHQWSPVPSALRLWATLLCLRHLLPPWPFTRFRCCCLGFLFVENCSKNKQL